MFCRDLHGLKGFIMYIKIISIFTKYTNIWLLSGEVLCLLRLFWLTSSRVTFSDKNHMGFSLLEEDARFYSNGSLCILQQNLKAYMEEQNVHFSDNFSLHIFQQYCKVIQEKISLTECQSRFPAKINRWSYRISAVRETARAEEPTL